MRSLNNRADDMKDKKVIDTLVEDLDKEVLKRMPLWFRRLREAYAKRRLYALY
jgi:hypothetical protein